MMDYVTHEQLYALITLLFLVGSMSATAVITIIKIVWHIIKHLNEKKK